jgi:hypothetical protein
MPAQEENPRMPDEGEERTVLLTVAELDALHALVTAKVEGVLVHSPEYFQLQDIAHKLSTAAQPRR